MAEEPIILICRPVKGSDDHYLVPGCVEKQCQDCGAGVWVSPSGQEMTDATIVCIVCGVIRAKNDPNVDVKMLPAQVREIVEWQRRN